MPSDKFYERMDQLTGTAIDLNRYAIYLGGPAVALRTAYEMFRDGADIGNITGFAIGMTATAFCALTDPLKGTDETLKEWHAQRKRGES
jgi:hypothetical protein